MSETVSKQYVAIVAGIAGLTGALVGVFMEMAWYIELPIAIIAGLVVGLIVATAIEVV